MTPLIQAVKNRLELMTCSVHHKHPEITAFGDKIEVSACCQEFDEKCQNAMNEAAQDSAKSQLEGLFKKWK